MGESKQPKSRFFKGFPLVVVLIAILPKLIEFFLRREFAVHTEGIVLISGASTGIGRDTCGYLAERHSNVTFYCGIRKESDGVGHPFTLNNVEPVILDVTKENDVNDVIVQVKESGMPLIGVISNAGVSESGTVEFQDLDTFRWHYEVNVFGTFRLTQAALALLRQSRGRVVLTGSMVARIPSLPLLAGYVGTKYAMEAFGDALRKEMEPRGVSVSLIEPGFLKSALTDKAIQQKQELLLQQEDAVSTEQERRVYPEFYNDVKQQELIDLLSLSGNMNETCQAMQDALFGKYPKTRYLTSRVGPFPTWLFVRLVNLLPDRTGDILENVGTRPLLLLQSVREYVERTLSFVTGGK